MATVIAIMLMLSAGCAGAGAVNDVPTVATGNSAQQDFGNDPAQGSANTSTAGSTGVQQPVAIPSTTQPVEVANRVEVVYFHVNQRCVACLCFEQNINSVIDKYY